MSIDFIVADRDTPFLFPPSVQEWLQKDHLARFVVDMVGQLNLSSLRGVYVGKGSRPYDPSLLLSLLFYGYSTGVFSSRKLEQATYDSVAFRYITGNQHPDHDTIAMFRKRFSAELKDLFNQILIIAHEMGILKLGAVSLDGTKVKANASKHQAMSWQHACKIELQLQKEVDQLWLLADQADETLIPDGMKIPEELVRREQRLTTIAEAKKKIEARATERYEQEKQVYENKLAEREQKAKERGRKPGGKAPKPPVPGPKPHDQVNLTDEESRIMPTSGGGFMQAFNAQTCVDIATMLIVATHMTQQSNDKQQIEPAIEVLEQLPEQLGQVKEIIADAGYFSKYNVEACEDAGINPLIAVGRDKHNRNLEERFSKPEPLAEDADRVTKMKHRLKTPEGKGLYGVRKSTVEPVFGIMKSVLGYRQFMRRGLENVDAEWTLVSLAWNLKRLHVLAKPGPKTAVMAACEAKSGVKGSQLALFCSNMRLIWFSIGKMNVKKRIEDFFSLSLSIVSPTGC
jgi:transposase